MEARAERQRMGLAVACLGFVIGLTATMAGGFSFPRIDADGIEGPYDLDPPYRDNNFVNCQPQDDRSGDVTRCWVAVRQSRDWPATGSASGTICQHHTPAHWPPFPLPLGTTWDWGGGECPPDSAAVCSRFQFALNSGGGDQGCDQPALTPVLAGIAPILAPTHRPARRYRARVRVLRSGVIVTHWKTRDRPPLAMRPGCRRRGPATIVCPGPEVL